LTKETKTGGKFVGKKGRGSDGSKGRGRKKALPEKDVEEKNPGKRKRRNLVTKQKKSRGGRAARPSRGVMRGK